jgi:hypothetical protein
MMPTDLAKPRKVAASLSGGCDAPLLESGEEALDARALFGGGAAVAVLVFPVRRVGTTCAAHAVARGHAADQVRV